jgi:hypothetical protein
MAMVFLLGKARAGGHPATWLVASLIWIKSRQHAVNVNQSHLSGLRRSFGGSVSRFVAKSDGLLIPGLAGLA